MSIEDSLPLPKSSLFREPLLRTLAEQTHLTPGVVVPVAVVVAEVLQRAQIDVGNLPAGWLPWHPRFGICNRIYWMAQTLKSEGSITRRRKEGWALTEKGVVLAALLCPPKAPEASQAVSEAPRKNATAQWLDEHLKPTAGGRSQLMTMLDASLRRHMPVSSRAGLIEDHINTFVMRVIHRDAFAKHLVDGAALPYSKVVSYCVNSGRTDARDMGTNPVCRELYGARTDRERLLGVSTVAERVHRQDTDGNIVASTTCDVEEASEFEDVWNRVEQIFRRRRSHVWERYTSVLALRVQGLSVDEIAKREGATRNSTAAVLADVRRVMRASAAAGELDAVLTV
jgi:hypothetical protein